MTLDDVRERVAAIERGARAKHWDPESLHGDEDKLYLDVLTAVADGHPDAQAMATEAVKVNKVDFPRWCA